MQTENTVRCNNCSWEGVETDLSLIETDAEGNLIAIVDSCGKVERFASKPEVSDFTNGCPNCKTDKDLMDL